MATFIQKGACSIYEHEWNHIVKYTQELEEKMKFFHAHINECDKLSGIMPGGGFFYLVNIQETGMTSNDFCAKLVMETGIATTPGIAFGEGWDSYVRFSLAVPMEQIKACVKQIEDFMKKI